MNFGDTNIQTLAEYTWGGGTGERVKYEILTTHCVFFFIKEIYTGSSGFYREVELIQSFRHLATWYVPYQIPGADRRVRKEKPYF